MIKSHFGKCEHWQTPLSNFSWLQLTQLQEDGCTLTLQILAGNRDKPVSYQCVWQRYCAYRSTFELEFRPFDENADTSYSHHTYTVTDSSWLSQIAQNYDGLLSEGAELQHFVVFTADHVIEVLSSTEPIIARRYNTARTGGDSASTYKLIIPEPRPWYSNADEDQFFNILYALPEVEHVQGYNNSPHNDLVLSLSQQYLSDDSLRNLLGVMTRYQLPMVALSNQCATHNEAWFKNPDSYWYNSVFQE